MWINSSLNQLFCIKHIEVGERENVEQAKWRWESKIGAFVFNKACRMEEFEKMSAGWGGGARGGVGGDWRLNTLTGTPFEITHISRKGNGKERRRSGAIHRESISLKLPLPRGEDS